MTRRIIALAAIVLVVLGGQLAIAVASGTLDKRDGPIRKGVDFLHAKQRTGGGFAYSGTASSARDTPWVILAISGSEEAPMRWIGGGGNPISFMQSQDLVAVATSDADAVNAPAYYAQCTMAFVAAGRPMTVYAAGTPRIDLIAKLKAYRPSGEDYFSPGGGKQKTPTTSWAIMALKAADEPFADWNDSVDWLKSQQNGDGGFGDGGNSTVETTSAAVLALRAGRVSIGDAVIQDAYDYLKDSQNNDGGFDRSRDPVKTQKSYAEPTAWAVQAGCSFDVGPLEWTGGAGGNDPITFLNKMQVRRGSFLSTSGNPGRNPLLTTAVALVGRSASKARYLPYGGLASHLAPTRWRPEFRSFVPANKATFKTNTVVISSTYQDNQGGTGIKAPAIRLTVDGKDKTKPAAISASRLALKLVNLANGSHTVTIKLADWAGNTRSATHTFTVNKPTPSSSPTPSSTPTTIRPTTPATIRPPTTTRPPTVITPTTPGTTITPTTTSPYPYDTGDPYDTGYPYDSAYPYASGSPSPSGSSALGSAGEGGGTGSWAMTALAILLIALVPIGALASYIRRQRLAASLGGASQGKVLAGGGSAWQRLKGQFTRGGSAPASGE